MSEFHIHIDAKQLSDGLERTLLRLGFEHRPFLREADETSYAPDHHLTLKTEDPVRFRHAFDRIRHEAESSDGMDGYIEGEYVPFDESLPNRNFNPSVAVPFRVDLVPLPPGNFRQSEIHVTFDRDRSDPRLKEVLRAMGFVPASAPKPYGMDKIYTVQGSRAEISLLLPVLRAFLIRVGGGVACSIKEERIARWWVSSPSVLLPPVIGTISWQ
jgi:hypothetical protein